MVQKKEYKKLRFDSRKSFDPIKDKDAWKDYDIVYDIELNRGVGYHVITIFKQPIGISDRELAFAIDGFFWDVIRIGNQLECWYD